jgi:hypothetical protein
MDNTKKALYICGVFLLISCSLIFIIHHESYTRYETVQGMVFICIVTTLYFILVHLYYKSKSGEKIVVWSLVTLLIISCICFYVVY